MKKTWAVLIAGMMVVGGGSAYAAAGDPSSTVSGSEQTAAAAGSGIHRIEILKEYQTQLHQLDAEKVKQLGLKSQIVEKEDKILDLTIAAKDAGHRDALKKAAAARKGLHAVRQDLESLHTQRNTELKEFREAAKAGDNDLASTRINEAIATDGQISGKLSEELDILNAVIAVLN